MLILYKALMPWITADEWATLLVMTVFSLPPSRPSLFILFPLVNPWSKCCPLSSGLNFCSSKVRWMYVQIPWPQPQQPVSLELKMGGFGCKDTQTQMSVGEHTCSHAHIRLHTLTARTHTHCWSIWCFTCLKPKSCYQSYIPSSISQVFERSPGLSCKSHHLHRSQQCYEKWHCDWWLTYVQRWQLQPNTKWQTTQTYTH